MRKLAFLLMMALLGITHQMRAADIVNNTSCGISVEIVFYNSSTCAVTGVCSFLTVPAHSTVTIPPCISSTVTLIGYNICWSPSVCTNCVSIGSASGPHPCAQYPAGPVGLSAECSQCNSDLVFAVRWIGSNLVIG